MPSRYPGKERDHEMKRRTAISTIPEEPLFPLVQEIRDLVRQARQTAARTVNTLQVATNYEIRGDRNSR